MKINFCILTVIVLFSLIFFSESFTAFAQDNPFTSKAHINGQTMFRMRQSLNDALQIEQERRPYLKGMWASCKYDPKQDTIGCAIFTTCPIALKPGQIDTMKGHVEDFDKFVNDMMLILCEFWGSVSL